MNELLCVVSSSCFLTVCLDLDCWTLDHSRPVEMALSVLAGRGVRRLGLCKRGLCVVDGTSLFLLLHEIYQRCLGCEVSSAHGIVGLCV